MKAKIITAFMALAILSSSCSDFLDEDPQSSLTAEQAYGSLGKIEPVLLGALTKWRNMQKDRAGLYTSLGTDEAQQGAFQVIGDANQAGLDLYNGFLSQENQPIGQLWNDRWPVIEVAAQSIKALATNTEEDSAKRDLLLGEASFLRATLMFELTQYWGEVPINDKERTAELGLKRQPLDLVYSYIVADLERSIERLPETQSNPSFPTKGVAQALLGKVYLYAPAASGYRDYNKAKQWFEAVINSGKYSLLPNFADLFDPAFANSTESLYEWQYSNIYPDNNQIQWQTGSRVLANVDQYCYFGGYDLILPTQYCYKDQADGGVWEAGDTRKDVSIRYDFTYKGVVPTLPAGLGGDELDPHIKKYEDIRVEGVQSFWNSGKNKIFIRYADVLLNYAEVLNELGNTGEAEGFVNQVRTRAFGGSLPAGMAWSGLSQDEFRVRILDERMRELAFEGWRRMDLIRTGHLVDYVKARNKWAAQNGTISEHHNLYPIPIREIKLNDEIGPENQNPGY
ncbi:RagB/SusD family nutrient uptake outer membrane protein [Flavobacterium sp. DG1-102-2]|uniref:RagB/SusD family nutrient uptake outer membrane protein n=1 Tax=Flavobacterium sp. DG1-102-2 TaxID=3081663 RepID=UPI00294929A3|nr:RagB/SusD family nutrient uptake outer membrane protein [Flavobacterium sp. DG1-102-2]MDV6169777.1 RagB/SusD family nutrient uptake outer membrane protein [Flavobacterium sp. DG1-102-2]